MRTLRLLDIRPYTRSRSHQLPGSNGPHCGSRYCIHQFYDANRERKRPLLNISRTHMSDFATATERPSVSVCQKWLLALLQGNTSARTQSPAPPTNHSNSHCNLNHPAFAIRYLFFRYSPFFLRYSSAFAPPTMSSSSIVMCVCLARLYLRVRLVIMSPAASVAAFMATMREICSLTDASIKH